MNSDREALISQDNSSTSSRNEDDPVTHAIITSTLTVCISSILAGLVIGYSSPALANMERDPDIKMDALELSLFGSIPCLTAAVGGILAGYLASTIGRKRTILITLVPYALGFLLIFYSKKSIASIILGRAITGLGMGSSFVVPPMYISEISPNHARGFLGSFMQIAVNLGILFAYIGGRYLDWKYLALLPCVFIALQAISVSQIPESPRYFISKFDRPAAKRSLMELRQNNSNLVNDLLQSLDSSTDSTSTSLFSTKATTKAFFMACGILIMQQFTGINVIVFYTEKIYQDAGIEDSNMASIVMCMVNIGVTFISAKLVDLSGRKTLLSVSGTLMSVFLAIFALYFHVGKTDGVWYYTALACPMLYIMSFAIGFGAIPSIYSSEILPGSIKEKALSIGNFGNWTVGFFNVLSFNSILVPMLGNSGAFLAYAIVVLAEVAIVRRFYVETRGKSLEQIETQLSE